MVTFAMILMLIAMLAIVVGIISVIILIVRLIAKKSIKKSVIVSGSAFSLVVLSAIIFVIISIVGDFGNKTVDTNDSSENGNIDTPLKDVSEVENSVSDQLSDDYFKDLNNYKPLYDLKVIERNPEKYKGQLFTFRGKITQVIEDGAYTTYRISFYNNSDSTLFLETFTSTLDSRFLINDYVTVYAVFFDLVTYETVLGDNRTVPGFITTGERIVIE